MGKIVVSGYGGGDFVAARYNAGVGLDQRLYVQQDVPSFNPAVNVTSVSNGNSVLERYRFTPYGQRTVLNNDFTADIDNTSDYSFDTGHQGLMHDAETGLIYNRAAVPAQHLGRISVGVGCQSCFRGSADSVETLFGGMGFQPMM